jgi:hypothetical protein
MARGRAMGAANSWFVEDFGTGRSSSRWGNGLWRFCRRFVSEAKERTLRLAEREFCDFISAAGGVAFGSWMDTVTVRNESV